VHHHDAETRVYPHFEKKWSQLSRQKKTTIYSDCFAHEVGPCGQSKSYSFFARNGNGSPRPRKRTLICPFLEMVIVFNFSLPVDLLLCFPLPSPSPPHPTLVRRMDGGQEQDLAAMAAGNTPFLTFLLAVLLLIGELNCSVHRARG
jgi:hypothetical protein